MPPLIDLTGQRFGRLVVIKREPTVNHRTKWLCVCDCGNLVSVYAGSLRSNNTASCGCIQREATAQSHRTHGKSHTRLWYLWRHMKARCYCKTNPAFRRYGGRGITVCEEWQNDFQSFYDWAMANGYQDNLFIDRIDNDKGYSPDNCRWATQKQQIKNRRNFGGKNNG